MPTINTSTIEGFDGMTAEQKVEALLKTEIPESIDLTGYVKKDLFDKTASELAQAKKAAKEKMTDDEKAAAETAAKQAELEQKYNELLKKSTVAENTATYLELGYDADLAKETAEALYDGDMEKVFANHKKANEAAAKKLRAELVKNDPKPDGAGGTGGDGDSDAMKMAKSIGKAKAENAKASADVLSRFKIQ